VRTQAASVREKFAMISADCRTALSGK